MSATYKVLDSDTDFLTAALAQSKVSVWYRKDLELIDQLMDYGGKVEGYTPESIKINGARFLRQQFEFRAYIK